MSLAKRFFRWFVTPAAKAPITTPHDEALKQRVAALADAFDERLQNRYAGGDIVPFRRAEGSRS